MREIQNWTDEEQKQLITLKEDGHELDDAIDVLYNTGLNNPLYDKYMTDECPEQIILDIVDYWTGQARFGERKYVVYDRGTGMYLAQEPYGAFYWSDSGTPKTSCQWLGINTNYLPFLQEVTEDENN